MSPVLSNDKSRLIEELLQSGCIKFGKFKLKSGIDTNHYVNLREIGEHPPLFKAIVDKIVEILPSGDKVKLVGVPYGAVGIAGAVAYSSGRPYHFVRKDAKPYGYIAEEQASNDESEYVILEDVMTTGSSIIETIEKMRGKKITDVIVVVNRQEGGIGNIQKLFPNLKVHSLLNSAEILARSSNKPDNDTT